MMQVKKRMTSNPVTGTPKTSYNEAVRLLQENGVRHLPIIDKKGKLVGIVSLEDLLSAKPSGVSTLSVYEIASLLETVRMEKVMTSPVFAVDENCSLTNAARFMIEKKIGCLPVLQDDKLVGIITDTDIFETYVEIAGGGQPGYRLEVKMPDEKGELAKIVQALAAAGSYIVSVALTYDKNEPVCYADIKERDGDEKKIREEIGKLAEMELLTFRPHKEDKLLSF
jgi:acetoin utilization protein AcuB